MSHRPSVKRRNLLRLGAAALIPGTLEEQGVNIEAIFVRLGINRRVLMNPERVVPLAWLARAFETAAQATAQVELGLLVGLRAGALIFDEARGQAPGDTQVGAALMGMILRPDSFPSSLLTMSVSGNTCTIECDNLPGIPRARDQLADCAIGFAVGALRVLCGPGWRPRGLCFTHAAPPDPLRHAALLQAPVSYDAEATTMAFDSTWLGRDVAPPQRGVGDHLHDRRRHRDLKGEVRSALAAWKVTSRPSAPAVASQLGLKPRTLHRLLCREGTSFIRMLENAQYETARRLLRDPTAPVAAIAWSLGYADASAFSRAFRRWSGTTPAQWRQAAERRGR